jgi:hypothetical protein
MSYSSAAAWDANSDDDCNDNQEKAVLTMRSERLTRKTHLKRHPHPANIAVYDLTNGDQSAAQPIRLNTIESCEGFEDRAKDSSFIIQADILNWCGAIAAQSPTGRALWNRAAQQGWALGLADLKSNGFSIDFERRHVYLDHFALLPSALGRSAWFRNTLLTTLFRALRDIWHEPHTSALAVSCVAEDVLMLERIRAADCDTVTLLVCWELRGAGFSDLWRHMIGSEEGDMALIFTRHLERDPSALFDGSALAYSFRQWHADENRGDSIDHDTLEAMDLLMAEPTGGFGFRRLSAADIEAMATLPGGICYLRGLGDTVRNDPFFAGLKDPINQTHLFHLIYDTQVVMLNNVPFRDAKLARLIFPDGEAAPASL